MENKVMDKTLFAVLVILFSGIGIQCFLQGQIKTGILRAVLGILCFVIAWINWIMGIILAINIFKMSDEEYQEKFGTLDKGILTIKE